jgi:hypothetical protein
MAQPDIEPIDWGYLLKRLGYLFMAVGIVLATVVNVVVRRAGWGSEFDCNQGLTCTERVPAADLAVGLGIAGVILGVVLLLVGKVIE